MRTSIYYEHTCILQLYCGASSANHIRGRAQVLPTQFSGHAHYQQAAIIISSPDVPGLLQGLVNGLQHGAISEVVTILRVFSNSRLIFNTFSLYSCSTTDYRSSLRATQKSISTSRPGFSPWRKRWVEVVFRTSWTWWDHSTTTLSMVWIRDLSWGSPLWWQKWRDRDKKGPTLSHCSLFSQPEMYCSNKSTQSIFC